MIQRRELLSNLILNVELCNNLFLNILKLNYNLKILPTVPVKTCTAKVMLNYEIP